MIAIIKDINTRQFKFNEKTYLKNFIAVFYEQGLKIVNVYDSKFSLGRFKYEDITVDGVTYADAVSLSLVLTPLLLQQTGTVKDGDFLDLINSHIENTTVHITALERQQWNNLKQYFDSKNTLLASAIANKVSYSYLQGITVQQQIIAQKNIGLFDHNHDDRYYRNYQIDQFLNAKLGINGTAKNALNAHKLGNHPPEYYANSATTYSKTDVDSAILTSMNEVVQMLLNNPDVEINSIQELLAEMTTADNALVSSIANKVSYVVPQNLSKEQQEIAQKNVGLLNHTHDKVMYKDARSNSIKPSDLPNGFSPYFALEDLNNQSSSLRNYVDLLVLNGWRDWTGFKINALSFSKTSRSIKAYQADKSSDIWGKPIEMITDDNFNNYLPTTITPEQSQAIANNTNDLENHTHETLVIPRSEAPRNLDDYPRKKLSLEFSQHLSTNTWDSAITVKGYSSVHGTWQLLSNASAKKAGDLFFRSGHSGNWGPLLRMYHSGNLPKQTVKPISTITTHTAKASEVGNIVPLNNANTQIILNTASFPRIGDTAKYFYKGTGTCKVATSGTATELCNINDTLEFDGQNSMIEITKTGANEYFVCGQLIRA
ncbi:hypothetical protein J2Q11_08710 [Tenacibaculum finnmarkense genomovar finnmarkense]|uniref:hypothetical protein n=1 Tax=Tenacibaculum finnmarkense TaxID=2781243 RepID=UPI001EFA8CF0|nr:hypothetical protein [Tenacibaculum finnmarkense]MCG8212922.1 hypothetical protein [Tenacibaculum finnmarkense genomovar finnmarkense]MCG8231207.1 hypothetical protein [Tenacibaculum finnmarkense genomovar finnmarkense]